MGVEEPLKIAEKCEWVYIWMERAVSPVGVARRVLIETLSQQHGSRLIEIESQLGSTCLMRLSLKSNHVLMRFILNKHCLYS
jgi:hypothetical protein